MPQISRSVIPMGDELALIIQPDEEFRDPAQPAPADLSLAGRYRSDESIFIDIATAEPAQILPFIPQLLQKLGSTFMRVLGVQLGRKDPQMRRAWAPLAPATLKNRKAQGRTDDYPYSDRVAHDLQTNRWGMDVQVDQAGGSVGMGWRGEGDDNRPHRALLEAESGTGARPVGPGHTTYKRVQRPLSVTEEVAANVTAELGLWINQMPRAFVPDAYDGRTPLLSAAAL